MTPTDVPTLSELIDRAERAECTLREYVRACFKWAEESGLDLRKAVTENPGRNCVDLLVQWLQGRARAAKSFAESLDNIREAIGQGETHHLVMAGDVAELVKAVELGDPVSQAMVVLRKLRSR
jgi:hypothetical protein